MHCFFLLPYKNGVQRGRIVVVTKVNRSFYCPRILYLLRTQWMKSWITFQLSTVWFCYQSLMLGCDVLFFIARRPLYSKCYNVVCCFWSFVYGTLFLICKWQSWGNIYSVCHATFCFVVLKWWRSVEWWTVKETTTRRTSVVCSNFQQTH